MYVKIKDPEKAAFIRGVLIFLAVTGAAVVILYPLYAHAGGLAELAADARNLAAELWRKEKFKCVMGLFAMGMVLFWLVASVQPFLHKWKHWNDPKRMRALDFAPEGVYLISDQKILLPYRETELRMLVHVASTYNSKRRKRRAFVWQVKLMFTWEKMTYTVTHLPTKKLLYALAGMGGEFAKFSFGVSLKNPDTREEKALGEHLNTQLENQVRYGLHRDYMSCWVPLSVALVWDVLGAGAVLSSLRFMRESMVNGATLLLWGAAVVLFGLGGLYWVRTVREWNVAQEIARRSGRETAK